MYRTLESLAALTEFDLGIAHSKDRAHVNVNYLSRVPIVRVSNGHFYYDAEQ